MSALIDLPATLIRSIDNKEVKREPIRSSRQDHCRRSPAALVEVAVRADGSVIGETRSDDQGHFEIVMELDCFSGTAAPALLVQGEETPAPALVRLREETIAKRAMRSAPPAATARATISAPSPGTLVLYDVQLKAARRAELEAAIEGAGGKRKPQGPSKSISEFDVSLLHFFEMTLLKIMFDGDDRFVQAKYEGKFDPQTQQALHTALTDRYGPPAHQPSGYVWKFDEALEIVLGAKEGAGSSIKATKATLLYVDCIAEASLKEIVK